MSGAAVTTVDVRLSRDCGDALLVSVSPALDLLIQAKLLFVAAMVVEQPNLLIGRVYEPARRAMCQADEPTRHAWGDDDER